MKKNRKIIPMRFLSLLLAVILLIGATPFTAFANESEAPDAAMYTVFAHGGSIEGKGSQLTVRAETAVTVTLDESAFPGHAFVCWKGDDGTEIPKKSFRLLVERNCAFYPVFSDLAGNFGEWREFWRGEFCEDGVIYVKEDTATGLKQFKFSKENHDYQYEAMSDGENHYVTCSRCPYTGTRSHYWTDENVVKEPTHTANGEKTYTCNNCKAVKTEIIPANTDDHSFEDWVVIEEPDGMTPGKRALKCRYCDVTEDPVNFITSSLPQKNVKIEYERISTGSYSRKETHYIGEDSYYFYIERRPYSFGFLYFDEGENSPVYIRSIATSVERYGGSGDPIWGILCYVDSYNEFVKLISDLNYGIYVGDNNSDVAMLYSTLSGYRAFEGLYNNIAKNGVPDTLQLISEYPSSNGEKTLRKYKYTGGYSPVEYTVDENNACISWIESGSEKSNITSVQAFEEFPFSKPDRNKITWYSCYVVDGSYDGQSYDSSYFNMVYISPEHNNFEIKARNAASNKVFSHWEKYDPYTWEWSYYSDSSIVTPPSQDVTTLRAVYKEKTYHIKVNGGYYCESGSSEKIVEGDIKAGTKIHIDFDKDSVPKGNRFVTFVDAQGNSISGYTTPTGDSEYTATYSDAAIFIRSYAENGEIFKEDGETWFWDGYFKAGDILTLTTKSAGEEYPYFLGWYLVTNDDMGEPVYELISAETTLNYTVPDVDTDTDTVICARWHSAPEIINYKFTVNAVNGFLHFENPGSLAVSDIRVPNDCCITVTKDPNNPLNIKRWRLTGTLDNGNEADIAVDCNEPTWIWLMNDVGGGKGGGKGDGSEQQYPWNITVTGEADICAEHTWDSGTVTKEPTYTEYGEITYTCTACGTQKTEPIPMLPRYCVHACGNCGGCTLPEDDKSCNFKRCTCGHKEELPKQAMTVSGATRMDDEITPTAYEIDFTANSENRFVKYVLDVMKGNEVEKVYDISVTDKDGAKYTNVVEITLSVGLEYAQAIADGKMSIIHITDERNVIYGVDHLPITADVAAGTVTFSPDSFSPFVLVKNTVAGDVNGDGKVDILDLVRLKKYIAGISGIEIREAAADLNGDGNCEADDLVLLRAMLLNA